MPGFFSSTRQTRVCHSLLSSQTTTSIMDSRATTKVTVIVRVANTEIIFIRKYVTNIDSKVRYLDGLLGMHTLLFYNTAGHCLTDIQ